MAGRARRVTFAKPTPSHARLLREMIRHPDMCLRAWVQSICLVPNPDQKQGYWERGDRISTSRQTLMACVRMGWMELIPGLAVGWDSSKPSIYRLTDIGRMAIEALPEEAFVSMPAREHAPSVKGKSAEVMRGLAARHRLEDGWIFIPEAPMPSPAGNHKVDALAMNCYAYLKWPLVGYEIKVSRSDFTAELREPAKTARSAAFCSAFYFACPAGLIEPKEVPDPYGLMVVQPSGRTRIVKQSRLERPEPTWNLVGLLMRRLAQLEEVDDGGGDE